MNKRRKNPVVTPEDGPCPKGMKAFHVHVCETYDSHYIVYAEDEVQAEEIANDRVAEGAFDPTSDGNAEYDNEVTVEGEAALRVVDLKPDGYITWKRAKYPYWMFVKDGEARRVSTVELQKALFKDDACLIYESKRANDIDDSITFFVSNDECDTVESVMEELFG